MIIPNLNFGFHFQNRQKNKTMTRENIKKLKKIINEVVEFPNGSMTFRKHVKHKNGSVDGWYAIL